MWIAWMGEFACLRTEKRSRKHGRYEDFCVLLDGHAPTASPGRTFALGWPIRSFGQVDVDSTRGDDNFDSNLIRVHEGMHSYPVLLVDD